MIPPETKLSKVRGVTVALIFMAMLAVGVGAIGLWNMLCAPGRWVARAFADLLEDETHIENMMKGG